jgi:hypothetical protein
MTVDLTQATRAATPAPAATKTASSAKKSSGATLFAAHLASASTKASSSDSTSTKTPKGEKTQAVDGHSYSEVIAGPRNGMFINHSGNKREGQAFARVLRDGREFHIYGSGKNRVICEVKHAKDTGTSNNTTTDTSQGSDSGSSTTSGSTAPATDTTGTPTDGS